MTASSGHYFFGVFEVNPRTGELRRDGEKLKIQEQPFQLLVKLLENAPDLVGREELRATLWPSDTFVDFETGLNTAIKRLREVLGDPADNPLFIQTLPRRGYRFIAPVRGRSEGTRSLAAKRPWSPWGIAATGVVIGALLAWATFKIPASRAGKVPKLTSVARLTHAPEFSEWPTWSPDGNTIAFASNRGGNFEIYVRRVEGGQEIDVTNDSAQNIQPDFSPDGNKIVFVSTRSSRTGMIKIGSVFGPEIRTIGGDVWVVPALGGQSTLLARDGNFPVWHPNGTKVLYVSGPESHRSLMEVAAEGGTPRALLPRESSNWEIARDHYSPNGRWITFETFDRELFILSASGGTPRKLLSDVSSHVWDPSGNRIYYCSRELRGGTRLQSWDIDESNGTLKGSRGLLGILTGDLRDLAMSRDGGHLLASDVEGSLNLTRLPLTSTGDAPAGPEEVLSRGPVFDREPSVARDGRRIAYTSDRLGRDELHILHLDSGRIERIQFPDSDIGIDAPQWFPDGQRLAVLRRLADGRSSLWMVSADGSHAEELVTRSAIWGLEIPISLDGKTVVYPEKVGGYYQFFSLNLSTRQARQLTSGPSDKYSGSWSPDGRWLVYSSNASGMIQLWKMPANGGPPEQLTKGEERIHHVFYSPDGRWLYFQPNHLNFYRMPANGGVVHQVTHFQESGLFIEEPTISPDGRTLYYCRGNGSSSLWLLMVGRGEAGSD